VYFSSVDFEDEVGCARILHYIERILVTLLNWYKKSRARQVDLILSITYALLNPKKFGNQIKGSPSPQAFVKVLFL
jgi:hypothetical protein